MTETTTLPIPPDTLLILGAFVGLVAFSYIVFLILPDDREPKHGNPLAHVNSSLGFRVESKLTAAFLFLLFMVYFAIFAFAAIIALRALGGILFLPLPEVFTPTQTRTGLAFGTLLAAILGAPLIVWRSWVAQKTAAIAEESLFNDKINAAATDLAARRQVTRVVKDKEGKETILTEWEDDLVTRAAAIDRLEGLAIEAMERDDYPPAQRIARMLSIYVQELSRAHPAQDPPEDAGPIALREWAAGLTPIRPDMPRAAQSLGRINPVDAFKRAKFGGRYIDLHNCNLQGFELLRLNLQGANLLEAKLQGANLLEAKLQGANLFEANLQEANLLGAMMQDAYLFGAELQGADLMGAKLQRADLRGAALQGADLLGAALTGADLRGANLQRANLFEAALQGADLLGAELQGADLRRAKLQGADLFEAKLQGAKLRGAQLQGAELIWVRIDEKTDLTDSSFRGVCVRSMDESIIAQFRKHWKEVILFADTLPEDAPAHWVLTDDHLSHEDFVTQWRAWAATLDPPVTIAPDYRP